MHLIGERPLGVAILIMLGVLVFIKLRATGSLVEFDRRTRPWVWLTNLFNLFFLLVVNPALALLLIVGRLAAADPTRLGVPAPALLAGLEIAGLLLYLLGMGLMAWALLSLGGNYQLGGATPRQSDQLISAGPYRLVRHPMYSAALGIALGLALLTQSLAVFIVFCVYLVLILRLIPIEESELLHAYGERFDAYQKQSKHLIPFVY